jgi:class 3 adenylate cyclase
MHAKKVFLILVDISGYTHFIRTQKMSAIHAEEIIFELLEAVIDRAAYPLTLNKLEGDAVFLYAEADETEIEIASRDVARQAQGFFEAFYARAKTLTEERAECGCNACQRVHDLRLKVILHVGEAIFRNIRQFEELAGEDVITIHRLLKNSVPTREYILMTDAFYRLAGNLPGMTHIEGEESYEDMGMLKVHIFHLHLALIPKPQTASIIKEKTNDNAT